MLRARIFRGNYGPAKNMASRLDETQNLASRLDETTGFDRHVSNFREGCLRQPAEPAARASEWTGILDHIDVRTPHARGMFGEFAWESNDNLPINKSLSQLFDCSLATLRVWCCCCLPLPTVPLCGKSSFASMPQPSLAIGRPRPRQNFICVSSNMAKQT